VAHTRSYRASVFVDAAPVDGRGRFAGGFTPPPMWTDRVASATRSRWVWRLSRARSQQSRRSRACAIWHCVLLTVFPPSDFGPAKTHRNPGGDQLQHEPAGVTAIIRQVIGELDADAPLFCHEPHFKWWRARRNAVPEHRQPVSFGEVGEHCRITARRNDPSGGRIRLEPMLFEMLLPHHAPHPILSIQDEVCSTIGGEDGRRTGQLFELTSGCLATRAIAGGGHNRRADCPEPHFSALARRGNMFALFHAHNDVSLLVPV
jgi:hypothetical protein